MGAADTAIAFAQAQLGKPYVFGATGPDSYDCSGLVQAAYRAAGVQLPRTTYQQILVGTPVAQTALAPGDLVFPSVEHVQLYIGGGKVIEAPHSGATVRVANMWGFMTARRVTAPGNPVNPNGAQGGGGAGGMGGGPQLTADQLAADPFGFAAGARILAGGISNTVKDALTIAGWFLMAGAGVTLMVGGTAVLLWQTEVGKTVRAVATRGASGSDDDDSKGDDSKGDDSKGDDSKGDDGGGQGDDDDQAAPGYQQREEEPAETSARIIARMQANARAAKRKG